MDENLKDYSNLSFQYLKQTKNELDALIIGRNELAKWSKRNTSTDPSVIAYHNNLDKAIPTD
jgi:hypothetical protein